MKWTISFASDVCNDIIRINSMRDLETLYCKYDKRLIVDFKIRKIIIYNYYVK